ncbi:DNA damage-inducible protein 1 [Entomophthora muscae]|uniref:DNA damage-inducible protein 1 n=1 Tax=Entomophthora muscae TaxID=34485 RepID=A0ACC2U0Z7_9FUNG|nr:DNA damage-inducible protein 1 [Entomophthora muscae]
MKIKAVLNTGLPVNIVSSKLMKKLKLAPNLNYHQSSGTASLSMTYTIGVYSALPMCFGKLLLAVPAVVLENESYDLLVGTQFLGEYNGIINIKDVYLSILGYEVPLIFEEPIKVPGKRLKTCVLEYCGVPVHQSPKCDLSHSQGLAGRSFHSLVCENVYQKYVYGLKWAFIHSQKEDTLRNLMLYSPGAKVTIDICQHWEFSKNILDHCSSVLDFYSLVFDYCFSFLESCSSVLSSSSLS